MGFFTRSSSNNVKAGNGSSSNIKIKFFSLPAISTSNSSMSHSEDDARSVSKQHGKLKLRNSTHTEPNTSASEDLSSGSNGSDAPPVALSTSSHIPPLKYLNSNKHAKKTLANKYTVSGAASVSSQMKIGTAVARSRSTISHSSKRSLKNSNSKKSLSGRSGRTLPRKSSNKSISGRSSRSLIKKSASSDHFIAVKSAPTDKAAAVVEEAARVKLEKDMMVLADGIHLDNNTKNLLASFDAKTIEDFFMMGEADFNLLLAKARNSNRGLPPLQIRKVRILREWLTQLVESTHPELSGLPWLSPSSKNHRGNTEEGLLPSDWKRRFRKDLPALKKKLRQSGDSWAEIFPWLSYLISFRDSLCGSRY